MGKLRKSKKGEMIVECNKQRQQTEMAWVAFDYEIHQFQNDKKNPFLVLSHYLQGTGVKIKLYQDSIDNNYLNF